MDRKDIFTGYSICKQIEDINEEIDDLEEAKVGLDETGYAYKIIEETLDG